MMIVENAFDIGDTVYLATDPEQRPRMVTGVVVRRTHLMYDLACGTAASWHYDYEITAERDVLKATGTEHTE